MPPKRRPPEAPPVVTPDSVSMDLFDQPGHLLRRANQIAAGIFNDLVGPEITPIQYAILRMVYEKPGIDQVGLARSIALDTSTTALAAARLATKGLIQRAVADADRRQLQLTLTAQGETLLSSLVSGVHQMREKLLDALDPAEQEVFMSLLKKFVHIQNDQSRAPMRAHGSPAPAAKPRKSRAA
jgi:DNA-binding MarR family transcriptional regulator